MKKISKNGGNGPPLNRLNFYVNTSRLTIHSQKSKPVLSPDSSRSRSNHSSLDVNPPPYFELISSTAAAIRNLGTPAILKEAKKSGSKKDRHSPPPQHDSPSPQHQPENTKKNAPVEPEEKIDTGNGNIAAQTFTFRELAAATKNFRPECLLGEGGFGRVYKGRLESSQIVAVKQLDRNGLQGNREFLVEVLMLSLLHHQNLVNLIGYCADGDQRLLVYEFMSSGSLEHHLLGKHS
ncbi:hypothetical protein ACLOJK_035153 [Asimina triloba]